MVKGSRIFTCPAKMLLSAVLLALLFPLLAIYLYKLQPKYRGMPPGPFVLPVVGSVPAIWLRQPALLLTSFQPWKIFVMLSKQFGDLFSFSVFNFDFVVIASYELFNEVANMDEYSAKFAHERFTYPRTFGKEFGLLFANSTQLWTEMRKFSVRTLRDFGFGKLYSMQNVISDEAMCLAEEFRNAIEKSGGVIKFRNTFTLPVLNVLWCMVAGVRYSHNDPKLLKLLGAVFDVSKTVTFINPVEIIRTYFARFVPGFSAVTNSRNLLVNELHEFTKSVIESRRAEGMFMHNPQNYIDAFLKKIDECKNKRESLYTEEQLLSMTADLLLVGSLTLNATLSYAVLFLILFPEIQRKCQDEIDSQLPSHLFPTIDDIQKMPFFQAFVLEVHRCANVVPNPIPRLAPNDWFLHGYKIPKGTVIVSNHYSVNTNRKIWGDPQVFRPERFLNEKGEFVPDPRVVIFGFGKRICIGIHLVNSLVPLFLASLLQKFKFGMVAGGKPPTTEPEIGVSLSPQEFLVKLSSREQENYHLLIE